MIDILGRTIAVGDIVAHGQRSGNEGCILVKVVTELRDDGNDRWDSQQVKVRGYTMTKWFYDKETKKGEHRDGLFMNDRAGWTYPERLLVINEAIDPEVREFLQEHMYDK